jgi:hypothetical protein
VNRRFEFLVHACIVAACVLLLTYSLGEQRSVEANCYGTSGGCETNCGWNEWGCSTWCPGGGGNCCHWAAGQCQSNGEDCITYACLAPHTCPPGVCGT